MIYQRESFAGALDAMLPLMNLHYKEIIWKQDKIPLSVNTDRYISLEKSSILLCYTARLNGIIKGYSLFMLFPALHFSKTIFAMNDMMFIHPDHRGGTGAEFLSYLENDLKSLGADVIMYYSRTTNDWSGLLSRKGFDNVYSVWQKYVGED